MRVPHLTTKTAYFDPEQNLTQNHVSPDNLQGCSYTKEIQILDKQIQLLFYQNPALVSLTQYDKLKSLNILNSVIRRSLLIRTKTSEGYNAGYAYKWKK